MFGVENLLTRRKQTECRGGTPGIFNFISRGGCLHFMPAKLGDKGRHIFPNKE